MFKYEKCLNLSSSNNNHENSIEDVSKSPFTMKQSRNNYSKTKNNPSQTDNLWNKF